MGLTKNIIHVDKKLEQIKEDRAVSDGKFANLLCGYQRVCEISERESNLKPNIENPYLELGYSVFGGITTDRRTIQWMRNSLEACGVIEHQYNYSAGGVGFVAHGDIYTFHPSGKVFVHYIKPPTVRDWRRYVDGRPTISGIEVDTSILSKFILEWNEKLGLYAKKGRENGLSKELQARTLQKIYWLDCCNLVGEMPYSSAVSGRVYTLHNSLVHEHRMAATRIQGQLCGSIDIATCQAQLLAIEMNEFEKKIFLPQILDGDFYSIVGDWLLDHIPEVEQYCIARGFPRNKYVPLEAINWWKMWLDFKEEKKPEYRREISKRFAAHFLYKSSKVGGLLTVYDLYFKENFPNVFEKICVMRKDGVSPAVSFQRLEQSIWDPLRKLNFTFANVHDEIMVPVDDLDDVARIIQNDFSRRFGWELKIHKDSGEDYREMLKNL